MATARSENTSATEFRSDIEAAAFPTREYIGAMALELAQMARFDGDEALARLLDAAATLAGEPLKRGPTTANRST